MVKDQKILIPLLQSPQLPYHVEELSRVLKEEEKRRADFYDWLDEDKKAEFILGEIVMHSPARAGHIRACQKLEHIISNFIENKDLGAVYQEQALVRFIRNDFMPDLSYFGKAKNEAITDDTTLFPVPDFIVEITNKSTEATDRGIKMTDYAYGGVKEYWIVTPDQKTIEQYVLSQQEYVLKEKLTHGTIRCEILKGLEFDIESIF